jgi:hypothetical protein
MLYSLSPWSALPVTNLLLLTANENIGRSWGGSHAIWSIGPFDHEPLFISDCNNLR